MADEASWGDLQTLANGLFPTGGKLTSDPRGRAEVRAAMEVILRIMDHQGSKLDLAMEQLDSAAIEIERLKAENASLREKRHE